MRKACTGPIRALSLMLIVSLCLTPVVFATEESNLPLPYNASTLPEPILPPNEDQTSPPETETEPEGDPVTNGEELLAWLQESEDIGGTLRLTRDIVLEDFSYTCNPRAMNAVIDTGEFSIIAEGYVEINSNKLTIRGNGGEAGVLRASEGSKLALGYLTIEAEGCAVFQEEGAGLVTDACTVTGEVRYADAPFAWEWKQGLAVVSLGGLAADSLPDTLEVLVNRSGGRAPYQDVPVTWEPEGHEDAQEERQRFTIAGAFEGMASLSAPTCTVVYDDYPLTFLLVTGERIQGRGGEKYQFTGNFTMPQDKSPITVLQEYSFDGEAWNMGAEESFTTDNTRFRFAFPAGEWDLEQSPHVRIRLCWEDDGTMYYSNVLGFAADNLIDAEDHGGNRGGNTDITAPPTTPTPDPPGNSNDSESTSPEPESESEPQPISEPPPAHEPVPAAEPIPVPRSTPTPAPEVSSSSPEPISAPEPPPISEPAWEPLSEPVPDTASEPSRAVSVAVGCTAVAGTIGVTGLCLHPQAFKRFLELLQKLLLKS